MTVASLHPAPACSACRARPSLYLLEADPARTGAADDSPVRRLPASVRLVCEPCAHQHAAGGALPPGVYAARLTAGMLAALAASRPRCEVITCTATVARWGDACAACSERTARAMQEELDAIAARRRAAAAERRNARRRKSPTTTTNPR